MISACAIGYWIELNWIGCEKVYTYYKSVLIQWSDHHQSNTKYNGVPRWSMEHGAQGGWFHIYKSTHLQSILIISMEMEMKRICT